MVHSYIKTLYIKNKHFNIIITKKNMDITLRQYMNEADIIHDNIVNKNQFLSSSKTKNQLYELESFIKHIQTISHRIAQIYNSCKKRHSNGFVIHRNLNLKSVGVFPLNNHWSSLYRTTNKDSKTLSPGIHTNVKIVDTQEEIPNVPLYWIRSLNQFAIHVNGVLLRGNIGNIYVKTPKSRESGKNIKKCRNENKCSYLLSGKTCRYYHDPKDILQLFNSGNISEEIYRAYMISYRNYTNISRLYTNDAMKEKNKMMRFIGNRNTLKSDLSVSKYRKNDWVDEYKSQSFHDFLVVLAMNQYGLLEESPDVKMISDEYSKV
jgi:hypothetical protein